MEEALWDSAVGGLAGWAGNDYARKYEVRLYKDGEEVGQTVTTEKLTYNFSGHFSGAGTYQFRVRAVRGEYDEGSWAESDERTVSDEEAASILVYIKGKGVVLKEPSVVALDRETNKVITFGEEARLMIGRTPGNIVAVRPLRKGVISDYTVTEKMLKYFIDKAVGKRTLRKPRIAVCIPSGATEVERKAVEDATYQAGAREVCIIEEPVAAAIGAGIDISKACGNMIVDIGGGTADIAVISLGGTVVSTSIKTAGDDFDESLVRYMRKKHNLLIGERTAEEIKINIGAAYRRPELVTMEVRGRNLVTGLPKTIVVTSDETLEALKEPAMQIVDAVHNVLERTPPELAADIFDRGIVLTGGGALLSGLDALIEEKTGITTMIAEEPLTAVAIGTGKFIEFFHGGKHSDR